MTWGRYENAKADIGVQEPNHAYGQWFMFENPINKPEVVKTAPHYIDTTIHLYTDGSSKGAAQTRDRKCFSGWGCNMIVENRQGSSQHTFSGGLYNADQHTAELSAVYQALQRIKQPCKIHIHSDSQYVITALKNLPEFIEKRNQAIEMIEPGERSMLEKMELKRLELWRRVERELNKPQIKGMTIQWIKSHQMDDQSLDYDKISPETMRDIRGNDMADKLSNIGVVNGIVQGLSKLAELHATDEAAYKWSSDILRKNFAASAFCKEVAIMYLVEKNDLLTPDIISNILDTYSSTRISAAIRDGINVVPVHSALIQTISAAKDLQTMRTGKTLNEPSYTGP